MAGYQHRTQGRLGVSSDPGAVAAPDFAIHHGRPDGLFGSEVGGINVRVSQECEPLAEVVSQVLRESGLIGDGVRRVDQRLYCVFQQVRTLT